MLDILNFSELLISGRRVNISGFWGVERGTFLKSFFSMPYSISTNQDLSEEIFKRIRRRYIFGEIALRRRPNLSHIELPSPILRKGEILYDRERRRMIRRAEEKVEKVSLSKEDKESVLRIFIENARKHGRKVPKGINRVFELEGVDVIKVYIGELVGAIMNLALEDRYLLWQIGWKNHNFLSTYLLHLSIDRGFSLGYDIVDLGITTSEKAMKVKEEMGCKPEFVYIVRFKFP